jgi:hypothetical protein
LMRDIGVLPRAEEPSGPEGEGRNCRQLLLKENSSHS